MLKVEEIARRAEYNHILLMALVEKGKMSETEKDNELIELVADMNMQLLDICIDDLYDDEDPEFARAILASIYKKTEARLKYFTKRYKFDNNRFNIED